MAKLNTNSNVYTIIYASVMVVVVAFLLAFVSSSLKKKQDANVAIDKKTQILAALNVRGIAKSEVEAQYAAHIDTTCVLTADGQVIEGADAFDVETKEIGEKFPIYMAKTADGQNALVLPVKGRGLWGGLWGYIAVTPDMQTVLGAYFNHESETAGLGALIKEEPFQAQFAGRPVFGEDGKVALTVVKKGSSENASQVDGVTGATLTSKGTGEMVHDGLQAYVDVLTKAQSACGRHEGCPRQHEGCGRHEGCEGHEGCPRQQEGCPEAAAHKCQSGSECCQSGNCDKSGSCGKPGCDGDKACCGNE
ncbi:MAG: FMN-binding protein [Bacteroidaceae bacterium]|nr:FMN-binding protein [Bacteroidaceae bacterium]